MLTRPTSTRLEVGAVTADHQLAAISGLTIRVPDPAQLVHLQFRRFAGCPVCNLHRRSFAQRHDAIVAAGIREVVFFHSTTEALLDHAVDLPFAVVADPDKRLYAEFGVESGARALLDPRAWWPVMRAVAHSLWGMIRARRPLPAVDTHGGRLGLPADFLIGSDGGVLACKYGHHVDDHVDDQRSVDELLGLARRAPEIAARLHHVA
jgi:peroxiredoxin